MVTRQEESLAHAHERTLEQTVESIRTKHQ